MEIVQNRRAFIAGAASAGALGLFGDLPAASAEPAPETNAIRLASPAAACLAPLTVAAGLLRAEGFTDVSYVPAPPVAGAMVADGTVDFDLHSWSDYLPLVDVGRPITVLAGIHGGCMELRAGDAVRSVGDLRGKRVGITAMGGTDHMLVSIMAAYVGLDPHSDIDWVIDPKVSQAELFADGKVDAFIGFPAEPEKRCPRDIGHVVVNTADDSPWSNYLCCMAVANTDFVRSNPVATKRALRAILKATDICHEQPEWTAQQMPALGISLECARTTLKNTRYGLWREYDPEDSVRFFALRLNELGMIRKTPNEIIQDHTEWRFVTEIKRELKT